MGHPSINDKNGLFSSRHLDDNEKIANTPIEANASNSVIKNVLNVKNKVSMSTSNITYLFTMLFSSTLVPELNNLSSSDK